MKQSMQVLTSSQSNEWNTPRVYTDAAREVMGNIDLDPASNQHANKWIGATRYFTKEDDGLSRVWWGNVWLNPPYGRTRGERGQPSQAAWSEKLIHEYLQGHVNSAILLSKCVPGYVWWEQLFAEFPVCFCRDRIYFIKLDDDGNVIETGQSKAASSFWYFGENVMRFMSVFGQFGRVILP